MTAKQTKPKKLYIYQLALRRADNEKQQFIIERDLITAAKKFYQKDIDQMSKKHKCDVQVQFIGIMEPSQEEITLNGVYHTEKAIEAKLNEWNQPKQEVKKNESI